VVDTLIYAEGRRKLKFKSIAEVILTVFLISVLNIPLNAVPLVAGQTSTTVFLDPPTIKGKVIGETVTVNINVSNVDDLYGWQAGMTFNPDVLNCTGYYEGEFLKRNLIGEEAWTWWIDRTPPWDNTEGIVYFHGCARVIWPDPFGVSGSGQLAYLTFKVIGTGISDLHLTDVKLGNTLPELIPIEVVDVFTVSWGGVDYSVKIISNLTGADNPPDPPASGLFNHTFSPQEKKITFDVITHHDGFYEATIPKAILRCDNLSDWTVNVDSSNVTFVPTESPTATSLYFTYHNGTHNVEITGTALGKPGDVDDNRVVNILDILVIAVAFGATPANPKWDPRADIAEPWNLINILDILLVAIHFGVAYP